MAVTDPVRLAMEEVLADGKPHARSELVAVGAKVVSPEKAWRRDEDQSRYYKTPARVVESEIMQYRGARNLAARSLAHIIESRKAEYVDVDGSRYLRRVS